MNFFCFFHTCYVSHNFTFAQYTLNVFLLFYIIVNIIEKTSIVHEKLTFACFFDVKTFLNKAFFFNMTETNTTQIIHYFYTIFTFILFIR